MSADAAGALRPPEAHDARADRTSLDDVIARSESDKAIQTIAAQQVWIASRSLSSCARSRDPLARNDGELLKIESES